VASVDLAEARAFRRVQHVGDAHQSQILFVLSSGTGARGRRKELSKAPEARNRSALRVTDVDSRVDLIAVNVVDCIGVVSA
jgi:hypothetical protein